MSGAPAAQPAPAGIFTDFRRCGHLCGWCGDLLALDEATRDRFAPSARAAVPVSIAVAARQNVPIYLTGLGTVQASFTVDIRAKVDGELQEVLFTEGQHVKKGDVLAKIDPRLFQAALDQAKAKHAQDAAALVAAEKDLARFKTLALKRAETQQNVDQPAGQGRSAQGIDRCR